MGETYLEAEINVRLDLKDADDGRPVVSQSDIRRKLNLKVTEVGDALSLQPSWVSEAIALVPGTSIYPLTSAQEYGEVVDLRFTSSALGLPCSLGKVSRERMQELHNVKTLPAARPCFYSLEPQPDQTIHVVFDSSPVAAEKVDALVSLMPLDWEDGATVPTIPYSKRALRAVELMTAAAIGYSMNQEQLNALKLNPSVFSAFERDAQKLLTKEWIAVSSLRINHGPTQLGWILEWRR
jgi:hypothetical protein